MRGAKQFAATIFISLCTLGIGFVVGFKMFIYDAQAAQIANDRGEYNDGYTAGYQDGMKAREGVLPDSTRTFTGEMPEWPPHNRELYSTRASGVWEVVE